MTRATVPRLAWRPDAVVADRTWFPRAVLVASLLVAGLCVLTSPGAAVRAEVLAGCAVTVAGMVAAQRPRALPLPLLVVWTYVPVVALLARDRSEGLFFVLVLALMLLLSVTDAVRGRLLAGAVAVVVPLGVDLLPDVRLDGWPFWTGGLLLSWFSVEQSLRYQALVAELARTRDRVAAQAVQLERRRIAADLHDIVGHSLGVVLLHVTGARRRLADDPLAAAQALARAEQVGRASLVDMRRQAAALREVGTDPVAPTPGLDDVDALVAERCAAGAEVTMTRTGDADGVDPLAGLAAYRVVQEALVNSGRHAPGVPVRVAVEVGPETVVVEVGDSGGTGRGGSASPGVGLAGMRERVEALGGTFAAGPGAGGWLVRAVVPRAVRPVPREPVAPS